MVGFPKINTHDAETSLNLYQLGKHCTKIIAEILKYKDIATTKSDGLSKYLYGNNSQNN